MVLRVSSFLFWILMVGLNAQTLSPALQQKLNQTADQIHAMIEADLDPHTGEGSGQLALKLNRLSRDLASELQGSSEYKISGLKEGEVFEVLKNLLRARREVVEVDFYRSAIEHMNSRLVNMGLGDAIKIVQSKRAHFLENFVIYSQKLMVNQPTLTPEEFIALARELNFVEPKIDGSGTTDTIKVPFYVASTSEMQVMYHRVNERMDHAGLDVALVPDTSLVGLAEQAGTKVQSQVALPAEDQPLPQFEEKDARLKKIRYAINMTVGGAGSLSGGIASGAVVSGAAGAATGALLEYQFGRFSDRFWNKVWYKWGFKALAAVNGLYPLIVSSVVAAVAIALHEPNDFNMKALVVKNLFVGMAFFMASFAALQTALSKFLKNGSTSAFWRFRYESHKGFIPQIARGIAIAASVFKVAGGSWHFLGVEWNAGDALAILIQTAFVFAITGPMWTKLLLTDRWLDQETQKNFTQLADAPKAAGGFWGNCRNRLTSITQRYTLSRQAAKGTIR